MYDCVDKFKVPKLSSKLLDPALGGKRRAAASWVRGHGPHLGGCTHGWTCPWFWLVWTLGQKV